MNLAHHAMGRGVRGNTEAAGEDAPAPGRSDLALLKSCERQLLGPEAFGTVRSGLLNVATRCAHALKQRTRQRGRRWTGEERLTVRRAAQRGRKLFNKAK